jgi:WD40 repeat protein
MRAVLPFALSLFLAGCGSRAPEAVASGPRLEASLVATWPAAAPARQAAFSADGRLLATSDASGLVTVRDAGGWRLIRQFQHPGGATSVVFGRDAAHLYSGGYDGTIRAWDLGTGKLARTIGGPDGTVWTIDVSPDGSRLAAGGEDKIIRIWSLDAPSQLTELRGHDRNIWEVRFSPDAKRIASGSYDATARLWDAESGRAVKTLTGHTQAIVGLDFSPDGKLLATGADDSTIRFWRASDGAPLRTIDNGTHVDKVVFSPDAHWLVSGGHPRGAIGELWHQLTGGGGNGPAVRIWRVSDGALVASLPHPDDVISLALSPDGRWLVTGGEDNRFRLWALRTRG